MNHVSQRNKLQIQLQSYKNFVPKCSNADLHKLLHEITVITNRIESISSMNIDELAKEVPFYFETKQSKCNHINFKM